MLYRIEFNEETTLDGLLESFKNLKNCGINCFVVIGQTTIFGSDEKLEEKLKEIFKSRKQVTTSKFIKPEIIESEPIAIKNDDIDERNFHSYCNLLSLSHDEVFKYYLNISLKYTKPEYKEKLKEYYIKTYSNDKYKDIRDIHLYANILLILNYKDPVIVEEKLTLFFMNLSENDRNMLSLTLSIVKQYSINGFLIEHLFQEDILDKDTEEKSLLNKKEIK